MQLQKFNAGTANVRHLLQSFTQAYDGLPSCVINVIGVATKADPQFIFNIELDVVLFVSVTTTTPCGMVVVSFSRAAV
ncbi:hypothetical protein ACNA2H_28240 [Klebsiella pneumoniae]